MSTGAHSLAEPEDALANVKGAKARAAHHAADGAVKADRAVAEGQFDTARALLANAAEVIADLGVKAEVGLWPILATVGPATEAILVSALAARDVVPSSRPGKRRLSADQSPEWEAKRLSDLVALATSPGTVSADAAAAALVRLMDFAETARVSDACAYSQRWSAADASATSEAVRTLAARAPQVMARVRSRLESADDSVFNDLVARADPPSSSGALEGPILICGFSHSGTRLAAQALARCGVFQHMPTTANEWHYIKSINTVLAPNWMDLTGVAAPSQATAAAVIQPEIIGRKLAAARYGGGAWGWKDPRGMVTAADWLTVFPDARIVHVIGDPRDALGTLPDHYSRYSAEALAPQSDGEAWAKLWLHHVRSVRAAMAQARASCEIRFEDLCRDSLTTLTAAFEALGVPAPSASDLTTLNIDASKAAAHKAWLASAALSPETLAIHERAAAAAGL